VVWCLLDASPKGNNAPRHIMADQALSNRTRLPEMMHRSIEHQCDNDVRNERVRRPLVGLECVDQREPACEEEDPRRRRVSSAYNVSRIIQWSRICHHLPQPHPYQLRYTRRSARHERLL
jgi:hypothetical protein